MLGKALYDLLTDANTKEVAHFGYKSKPMERKRAHSVTRKIPIHKDGETAYYTAILHYAPELGYWGCLKNNHGNLIYRTDTFLLASTVRMLLSDCVFRLRKVKNQPPDLTAGEFNRGE